MIYRQHYLACVSAASLAMGLCSVPAAAQDAAPATTAGTEQPAASPPADTAPASDSGNDTAIVITAQKRSENVQSVPISVAAFSGQTLTKSNVTDISQLGRLASNYQATKSVQSSFMRVNIRGIGAIGNTTIEPSVAISSTALTFRARVRSSARFSTSKAWKCCAARRAPSSDGTPASARFRCTPLSRASTKCPRG